MSNSTQILTSPSLNGTPSYLTQISNFETETEYVYEPREDIFNVIWQNRLVPETTVRELHFFPKRKVVELNEKWKHRLKGFLFLDWNFGHISNNKLQIRVDPNFNDWLNKKETTNRINLPSHRFSDDFMK
jgi:hypothetical protein